MIDAGVTHFRDFCIGTEATGALNQEKESAWDFRMEMLSATSKIPLVPFRLGIELAKKMPAVQQ